MASFFTKMLAVSLLLVTLCPLQPLAIELSQIKIGVLSFQPKSTSAKRWAVLADHLKKIYPELHHVVIKPMKKDELEKAISNSQIDFVLTNPAQYIRFHNCYGLSAPLATVIRGTHQTPLSGFGGTIFVKADNNRINTLADISTCRVAVPFLHAFGAAQMQQYELHLHHYPVIPEDHFVITGLPHDTVVKAVQTGEADVGFARAGTLERMVQERTIAFSQFKIIHEQPFKDFPARVSTHLYPEWPIAALRHVSQQDQSIVLSALLQMHRIPDGKLPFGVCGFSPPADYSQVENLMRTLRLPPFDRIPEYRLTDIWTQYKTQSSFVLVAMAIIVLLTCYLFVSRRKLYLAQQKLMRISERDPLTGLYNRRKFMNYYEKEWKAAQRSKTPLAVLMIDIDHFKDYNDHYGHLAGDVALTAVAGAIETRITRPRDCTARYGGEEFIGLLPETDDLAAAQVAEKIRIQVEKLQVQHAYSATADHITVSIGITSLQEGDKINRMELINLADKALYEAKEAGRNCVKIA
ncbi:diguanylate cyclase [Desulfuromonas acetoxidans]|uniref:diguanylate cyclase n=1 Tax=Desulfuromonas acetoxidans TaxID=891 RepID=UPI002930C90E|nr:diguanylate cyclase [Desulfuromonas acetoxidans]